MDQPWDYAKWFPTAPKGLPYKRPNTKKAFEELQQELIDRSKEILEAPYFPVHWLKRAAVLNRLGYPELSAGDTFKTMILVKEALDPESALGAVVRGQDSWNVGFSFFPSQLGDESMTNRLRHLMTMCYSGLAIAAGFMGCAVDFVDIGRDAFDFNPNHLDFRLARDEGLRAFNSLRNKPEILKLSREAQKDRLTFGGYMAKTYPWCPSKYQTRTQNTVDKGRQDLKAATKVLLLKPSTIRGRGLKTDEDTCYGLFAKRNIKKGELVLDDKSPMGTSYEQMETHCFNCFAPLSEESDACIAFECCPDNLFCSSYCWDEAEKHYHKAICGRNILDIYERANGSWGGKGSSDLSPTQFTSSVSLLTGWSDNPTDGYHPNFGYTYPASEPVILLRIFAMCLTYGGHPLEHPFIARLSVQPTDNYPFRWSLGGSIKGPLTVLRQLGIDIWADPRYDTWVVQMVWWRLKNSLAFNDATQVPNFYIPTVRCFMNHSCVPNVATKGDKEPSSYEKLYAQRDIEKGEEIFVSYIDINKPRSQRQAALQSSLGMDCKCERCVGELRSSRLEPKQAHGKDIGQQAAELLARGLI